MGQAHTFGREQRRRRGGILPAGKDVDDDRRGMDALIHGLADRLEAGPLKVVGCGFGVGLSWGAFAGEIGPLTVAPIQTLAR